MKKDKKAIWISLIILVALVIFIGSYWLIQERTTNIQQTQFENVSLRLEWIPVGDFAGEYSAVEEGFFIKNGINCIIRPGGPDHDPAKLVAAGSDQFGLLDASRLLLARNQGVPIVALAVKYQKSPICFFAKKQSGISKPQDFIGKTVGMKYGFGIDTQYSAMLKKLGIERSSIKEVPVKFDMAPFFSGEVDVWPGYINNEPILAQKMGYEVNIISPTDYGINMFGVTVITSEKLISENPNLVKRFLDTWIESWEWTFQNRTEALNNVLVFMTNPDVELQRGRLESTISLMTAKEANINGIGWMDRDMWQNMQNILLEEGILESPVNIDKAINLDFLSNKRNN